MTDEQAATVISRVQIIRTWAATPTCREDVPRITNKDCEKVVVWLDDALALLNELQAAIENRDHIIELLEGR